jgi:hypothetical protein
MLYDLHILHIPLFFHALFNGVSPDEIVGTLFMIKLMFSAICNRPVSKVKWGNFYLFVKEC